MIRYLSSVVFFLSRTASIISNFLVNSHGGSNRFGTVYDASSSQAATPALAGSTTPTLHGLDMQDIVPADAPTSASVRGWSRPSRRSDVNEEFTRQQ
jgi:hypothetical protein